MTHVLTDEGWGSYKSRAVTVLRTLSGAENFLESQASLNLRKRSPARIQFESLNALVF